MFNRNRKPWRVARTLIVSIAILGYVFAAKDAFCATIVWDELTDGDLSTDIMNPTDLGNLQIGEWDVRTYNNDSTPKYFSYTLDTGINQSATMLVNWEGPGQFGFVSVKNLYNGASWANMAFDSLDEYTDIQPKGTLLGTDDKYRWTVANFTSGTPDWTFRLRIVPEPTTAVMLGLGLGGLIWYGRSRG